MGYMVVFWIRYHDRDGDYVVGGDVLCPSKRSAEKEASNYRCCGYVAFVFKRAL